MITSPFAARIAAFLVAGASLGGVSLADTGGTKPSVAVGSPAVVRGGTEAALSWKLANPSTVMELVDIDPEDGTVTPKSDLHMDLRVLGARVQTSSTDWLLVEGWVMADGESGWSRFFRGGQPEVNPDRVCWSMYVRENRPIFVGGRTYHDGWYPFYRTGRESLNVTVLVNGDEPPEYVSAFRQGNIESFFEPYLDAAGRISIGPLDVIFLYELAMTSPGQSAFDMQDLVVLATFRNP